MDIEQKEKRKKLLIIITASVINFIAITLLVVFIIKYKDGSFNFGGDSGSKNGGSEIIKSGNWSCFALSAFGQIYLDDGQEMKKELDAKIESTGDFQYKTADTNATTTGTWKMTADGKDDSEIDFHVEMKGKKAFFYDGASDKSSLDRYSVYLYPKDTSIETSDGKSYQIELRFWKKPKSNSEFIAMIRNSNLKNFFSAAMTMYCANTD